jgi:hypothetical protein
MTPYNLLDGYQGFEGICWPLLQQKPLQLLNLFLSRFLSRLIWAIIIPEFYWRNCGKLRKSFFKTDDLRIDIWILGLPNTVYCTPTFGLRPPIHVQFRLPIGLTGKTFTVWPLIVFPHTRADKPADFMATVLQPMSPSAVRLCFQFKKTCLQTTKSRKFQNTTL